MEASLKCTTFILILKRDQNDIFFLQKNILLNSWIKFQVNFTIESGAIKNLKIIYAFFHIAFIYQSDISIIIIFSTTISLCANKKKTKQLYGCEMKHKLSETFVSFDL